MVFLKDKVVVIDESDLRNYLSNKVSLATYHREEGLYVATMEARPVRDEEESSFTRPGVSR